MRWISASVVPVLLVSSVALAPVSAAECSNAGATTICSQGEVRSSGPGTGPVGSTGPYVPYPCEWGYYACDDLWNVGINLGFNRP